MGVATPTEMMMILFLSATHLSTCRSQSQTYTYVDWVISSQSKNLFHLY